MVKNNGNVDTKVFTPKNSTACFTEEWKEVLSKRMSSLKFQVVAHESMITEGREIKLTLFSEAGDCLPFSAMLQPIKSPLQVFGPRILICSKPLNIGEVCSVRLEVKNTGSESLLLDKFAYPSATEILEVKYTKRKASSKNSSEAHTLPPSKSKAEVHLEFSACKEGWQKQQIEIRADTGCFSGPIINKVQQLTIVSCVGLPTKSHILDDSKSKPCSVDHLLRMGTIPLKHIDVLKSHNDDSWAAALSLAILPYDLCEGTNISPHVSEELKAIGGLNKDIAIGRFVDILKTMKISKQLKNFLDKGISKIKESAMQEICLPNSCATENVRRVHRALVVAGTPGDEETAWSIACACLGGCMNSHKHASNFIDACDQFWATLRDASEADSLDEAFARCRDIGQDVDMKQMDVLDRCLNILCSGDGSIDALLSCLWDKKAASSLPAPFSDVMAAAFGAERALDTRQGLAQRLVSKNVQPVISRLLSRDSCLVLQGVLNLLQIQFSKSRASCFKLTKIAGIQKLLQGHPDGLVHLMKSFGFTTEKTVVLKRNMASKQQHFWLEMQALEALKEVFSYYFHSWWFLESSESKKWTKIEKIAKSIIFYREPQGKVRDGVDIQTLRQSIQSGSPVR